jgi:dihydroorotase
MPIPKSFDDRQALIEAATSGNPKFFLGSDSAPHLRSKKECGVGASGVFTAPILPELLVQVFDEAGSLDALPSFCSKFGADFYGLEYSKNAFSLQKCDWVVPNMCSGIVPFKAGETLRWKRV